MNSRTFLPSDEDTTAPKYRVRYDYVNSNPGGPYRGGIVLQTYNPPRKGDQIRGIFGLAEVRSVRREK